MKRILTLLFVTLISIMMSYGQYYYNTPTVTPGGNPGGLNSTKEEPYGNGLHSSWVNIQPAADTLWTAVQTIPFSFQFNGASVTQYKVSTTGVVTFDVSATTYPPTTNAALPSSWVPDKSICIWGLRFSGNWSNDKIVKNTFGTAPNRQHWIFFASYNSNASGNDCWTYWSIVLEETTNRIYIVDQRNSTKNNCQPSLTLGLQVNSSTAYMVSGSPNIHSQAGKSKYSYDNEYYEFIPGTRPVYDIAISYIQTASFLAINAAPFEVRGFFYSYGATNVNSYDINYQIDNGPIYSEHVTGSSIPTNGDEWYFHDSLWNPIDTGIYTLSVWVSNINGHPDDNHSNDTMKKEVQVSPVFTPRLQLYEVFTSSTNPDCLNGNAHLKTVLQDNYPGEFTMIKYQMNYPGAGDPYYTTECTDRATYYGIDSLPDMMINGKHHISPDFLDTLLINDYKEPSYMALSVTHHRTGQTFDVTANIIPFVDFSNVSAHIVIVENQTINNASTNGETVFYYVMKKMLPNANGANIAQLYSAVPKPVNKTYTFDASNTVENFSNLSVISFIQDNATKEILQSAWSLNVSGIDENDKTGNGIIGLFPNPAQTSAYIKYLLTDKHLVTLDVYNLIGEKIYSDNLGKLSAGVHTTEINTNAFAEGVYLLNITIGNYIYSKRLTVSK